METVFEAVFDVKVFSAATWAGVPAVTASSNVFLLDLRTYSVRESPHRKGKPFLKRSPKLTLAKVSSFGLFEFRNLIRGFAPDPTPDRFPCPQSHRGRVRPVPVGRPVRTPERES